MKNTFRFLSIAVITVFMVNCSANLKTETDKWQKYQTLKTELEQKWPNFKPALDSHVAEAKKLVDEANQLSDEKAKAEKLSAANDKAGELLDKLRQVKDRLASTKETLNYVAGMRYPRKMARSHENLVQNTNKIIAEVSANMANANPATSEEAINIAKEQVSKLISAEGTLKQFKKRVRKSKKKKKKK